MELFLFRHSEYERLYNCSQIEIEAIPLERRRFPGQSTAIILLCAIYYALYVPCMFSIYKYLDLSCHKILFFIGIVNLSILWILGFYVGFMSLRGHVFCSHPFFGYFIGLMATSLWICESSADILLALNRCLDILAPNFYKILFDGFRTWIWCGFCAFYSIYWFLFVQPALYSSTTFGGWFFNPYAGFIDSQPEMYYPKLHTFHNYSTAILVPTIYLLFSLTFLCKFKVQILTGTGLRVFLQVFCLSMLNTFGATLYVSMELISSSNNAQILDSISMFFWFHIHGFPSVVYLLLNITIRQDCKELMKRIWGHFLPKRHQNVKIKVNPSNQIIK